MVGESSIDQTFPAVDRPLNPWQVTTSSRGMFGEAAIPRGDLNRIASDVTKIDRDYTWTQDLTLFFLVMR